MYALPHTSMGRRALWLLLPVLLYALTPAYMLINLLIPDSWSRVGLVGRYDQDSICHLRLVIVVAL